MNRQAFSEALRAIPYARFLGVDAEGDDACTARMAFSPEIVGNPLLPALHGGSIAAFMEVTATAALSAQSGPASTPRLVDVSIAYLRSGRPVDVLARADIRKVGRRIAYIHVRAWQEDEAAPIAELAAHFLISRKDGD